MKDIETVYHQTYTVYLVVETIGFRRGFRWNVLVELRPSQIGLAPAGCWFLSLGMAPPEK